jgi:hypothetical protein
MGAPSTSSALLADAQLLAQIAHAAGALGHGLADIAVGHLPADAYVHSVASHNKNVFAVRFSNVNDNENGSYFI